MKRTIIILGGGGFLATYLANHFGCRGWRVVSVGNNAAGATTPMGLSLPWRLPHDGFADLLTEEKPDVCVNACGRASVPNSMIEPLADFQANTHVVYEISDSIRRRSLKTAFIQISSAAIYGDQEQLPIAEDALTRPLSPYGLHKRMSEEVLAQHAALFGLRTASLRVFSAYGIGLRRQVVWDLATRVQALRGKPLILQGRAEDSRDFVHAADVAAAVEKVVVSAPLNGEVYNVASGEETLIYDLATQILDIVGVKAPIVFDEHRRPGNPSRWRADITRLRALGFETRTTLEDGVREVVQAARQK
jgi:UDP-glucose 4-epimerase